MAELMRTSESPITDGDPNAPETVVDLFMLSLQIAPIQRLLTT